jgi:adenylylsulfate kinase-like enzyme
MAELPVQDQFDSARISLFCDGSWLMADGSWLMADGSWLMAGWLVAHCSLVIVHLISPFRRVTRYTR